MTAPQSSPEGASEHGAHPSQRQSGPDPTSDPIGGACGGHDELGALAPDRRQLVERLRDAQQRHWKGGVGPTEFSSLLREAIDALAAAGTAPTPRQIEDAANEKIVAMSMLDERWWRTDETGRYYVGPTIAGDGSIEWPETAPTPPDALARLEAARAAYADEKDREAAGEVADSFVTAAADALAAAALDIALTTPPPPEDGPRCPASKNTFTTYPTTCRLPEGHDGDHDWYTWQTRDTTPETAPTPPTVDVTALREILHAEHPCAGACLGCGAGPDEACIPPCRCDEGPDCAAARAVLGERERISLALAAVRAQGVPSTDPSGGA